MANQIEKVNTIDITSIEKINLLDDDDIEKLNLLEFTGTIDFTWSTGGTLYAARSAHGAAGTQGAALSCGGGYANDAGEYNGATSTWSQVDVGNLSSARGVFACGGSQGAAITAGGQTAAGAVDTVETYGGSAWASEAAINQATSALNGCGAGTSNTSFLMAAGDHYPGGAKSAETELFNGSTWSDDATMDNAANYIMTFGASDDCFVVGGYGYPSQHNYVQHLSSGSFSVLSETLVSHSRAFGGCFGTTSSGLVVGGSGKDDSGDTWGYLATTEEWNGSVWATDDAYPVGACNNCQGTGYRASGAGGGLMWGGATPTNSDYTGEYG